MNYLAHAVPFVFAVDDELAAWRVAGTSLPDWLRVIDKKARLRPDVLDRAAALFVGDNRKSALVEGARRHHDDDLRFHTLDEFEDLNHDVGAQLRARFPHSRASTMAHVMVEMLLDACLIADRPTLLDRYYDAVGAIDDAVLAEFVVGATGRAADNVPYLLDRFRRSRFLASYATDEGLLDCLRGVWSRAGLGGVDDGVIDVVRDTRAAVRPLARRLFP